MKVPQFEWGTREAGAANDEWFMFGDAVTARLHNSYALFEGPNSWRLAEMFGRQDGVKMPNDSAVIAGVLVTLTDRQRIALDCIVESGDSDDPRAIAIMEGE